MTCRCCNDARPDPASYRFFAEGCLHCAARRIQYLQRVLQLGTVATQARCRAALAQALERGLSEAEIRRMAKLKEWQVAPDQAPEPTPKPKTKGKK